MKSRKPHLPSTPRGQPNPQASCKFVFGVLCVQPITNVLLRNTSVQMQSWPLYLTMYQNLPYSGKFLDYKFITLWEETTSRNLSAVHFIKEIFYLRNL